MNKLATYKYNQEYIFGVYVFLAVESKCPFTYFCVIWRRVTGKVIPDFMTESLK